MLQSTKTMVNFTELLKQAGLGRHLKLCGTVGSSFLTVFHCPNNSVHYCLCPLPILPLHHIPTLQGEVNRKHTHPFSIDPWHKNTLGMLFLDLKSEICGKGIHLTCFCCPLCLGPLARLAHLVLSADPQKTTSMPRHPEDSRAGQLLYSFLSCIYLIPLPSARNSRPCT